MHSGRTITRHHPLPSAATAHRSAHRRHRSPSQLKVLGTARCRLPDKQTQKDKTQMESHYSSHDTIRNQLQKGKGVIV